MPPKVQLDEQLRTVDRAPLLQGTGIMHTWLAAGFWGWLSGSALLIGAGVGWFFKLPVRLTASVMAFGSGVLISALSFDLMEEAQRRGGLISTGLGFVLGAVAFTTLNWLVARRGGKHRKNSHGIQPSEQEQEGSGTAIALGALLDGIPESIVIGTTLISGGSVSAVAVIAIFISNLPEGLSSSIGMKHAGRSFRYVVGLWLGIAFISGIASVVGYTAFRDVDPATTSLVTAIAAGAILAMLVDTMIPEAFQETHTLAGLVTVIGFLCAFALSKIHSDGSPDERTSMQAPSAHGSSPAGFASSELRLWSLHSESREMGAREGRKRPVNPSR